MKSKHGWVLMVRTGFGDLLYSYKVYPTRLAALMARPGHATSAFYAKKVVT